MSHNAVSTDAELSTVTLVMNIFM